VTIHQTKELTNHQLSTLRGLPDWSILLEILIQLLQESTGIIPTVVASATTATATGGPTVTMVASATTGMKEIPRNIIISEYDRMCLEHKGFYQTLLKQSRYLPYLLQLIPMFISNYAYTNMWIELFKEEMMSVTLDNMSSLFQIWKLLLLSSDDYQRHRIYEFFGLHSKQNIFTIFKNYRSNTGKQYIIVSFIRSLVTLLSEVHSLYELLGTTITDLYAWAPWMLQYLHQLQVTSITSTASTTTATNTTAAATGGTGGTEATVINMTGPYVMIYGEHENERNLPWSERYQKTYQALSDILMTWGFDDLQALLRHIEATPSGITDLTNSSALVVTQQPTMISGTVAKPSNTTASTTTVATITAQPSSSSSSSTAPKSNSTELQLHDGMTDEELMQFLSSQPW